MGSKSNQPTLQETTLTRKSLKLINFQPQMSFSNNLFLKSRILKISDFISYKYALFVRNSLRKENLLIFNMFTPLSLNHTHNTHADTNHFLDIPQRQANHYGTYSITSIASSI